MLIILLGNCKKSEAMSAVIQQMWLLLTLDVQVLKYQGKQSFFHVREAVVFVLSSCLFHIKDEYFIKVNDPNLMQNKENGNYRPTFYCMRDEKTSLLWLVPLSSRVEKFQAIYNKQIEKYGNCLTIVMGEYDGKQAAFLLQNMFPDKHFLLGNP